MHSLDELVAKLKAIDLKYDDHKCQFVYTKDGVEGRIDYRRLDVVHMAMVTGDDAWLTVTRNDMLRAAIRAKK